MGLEDWNYTGHHAYKMMIKTPEVDSQKRNRKVVSKYLK